VEGISADGRSQGALHDCFIDADGSVMVVDEWESAEAFQGFFENNQEIPKLMEAAGAQGPPEVTIHRKLDTPGVF
jgi:heme-degrading monooxygenase HmoA